VCYIGILAEKEHFDQFRFHCGGIERSIRFETIQTRIPLKQTELDYICKHFPQDGIYTWKFSIIYSEGDDTHFGKTYLFDKISSNQDA
jgi:hypothetical protein